MIDVVKMMMPAAELEPLVREAIQECYKVFTEVGLLLEDGLPDSREKSLAFTKLQEAKMWATEALAKNDPVPVYRTLALENLRDGYHSFENLYSQRMVLFATLVNTNKDIAWKTRRHEDGELCFGGGWFLVTIETPEGAYGYHYKDEFWDVFECKELPQAKPWDGYTEKDAIRLLSLAGEQHEN